MSSAKGFRASDLEEARIREVFIVKSNGIDLFGALVRKNDGAMGVAGRVLFGDGSMWVFESPRENPEAMRDMLASLCRDLAASYGTEVFNMRFHEEIAPEDFLRKLREARQETVFH